MKIKALYLILALSILFYNCKKSNLPVENEPKKVTLNSNAVEISGLVLTSSGYPAIGVSVYIDEGIVKTNADGFFEYSGNVKDRDKVTLKIEKQGYFTYSKILVLEEGASLGGLKFYIREELDAGTFISTDGGTIATEYATINFQSSSVLRENGSVYQGIVKVKMPFSTLQQHIIQYPGDARALTITKDKAAVDFWGGFNIILLGENGEKLKLSKPMRYSYKMDWKYVYAPFTLKLWTYSEIDGVWLEDGVATRSGEFLNGTTSSLSYLAWGISYPSALLVATVRDSKMNLAANFIFHNFTEEWGGGQQTTIVNSKGNAMLYIPAGRKSSTAIMSQCVDRLGHLIVNPIPEGKTANQIFTVSLSSYITSVTGKVEDCDFASVDGKAELVIDGKKYVSEIKDGNYNFNFISCATEGVLTLYDKQNKQIKKEAPFYFLKGIKNIIPVASNCTIKQKGEVTIIVDGETHIFQTPQDDVEVLAIRSYNKNYTVITASSNLRKESFYITIQAQSLGTFPTHLHEFSQPGKSYQMLYLNYPHGEVVVSKYKSGKTIMEGKFNSNVTLNPILPFTSKYYETIGTFNITY